MKKTISLLLAVAVMLSLGAVSVAAASVASDPTVTSPGSPAPSQVVPTSPAQGWTGNSTLLPNDTSIGAVQDVDQGYALRWNEDENEMWMWRDENPAFGKTIYYALLGVKDTEDLQWFDREALIKDSKAVAGLNLTPKWTDGGSYVKSVEFVKKGGYYYIAVSTQGSSMEAVDVAGKIYLKGASGANDGKEKLDCYFSVDFTLDYGTYKIISVSDAPVDFIGMADPDIGVFERDKNGRPEWDDEVVVRNEGVGVNLLKKIFVVEDKHVYNFDEVNNDNYTIYFGEDAKDAVATFEADVTNEKKVLLSYDADENADITAAYPKANLDFVNLTGSFKKAGTLTIFADEGKALYKVTDDTLVLVKAEYDEAEGGFVLSTKALGSYVIADAGLQTADKADDVVVTNPATGAAA